MDIAERLRNGHWRMGWPGHHRPAAAVVSPPGAGQDTTEAETPASADAALLVDRVLTCADCPAEQALEAHCVVELPAIWWLRWRQPEVWVPVCEDYLADYRLSTRVVDFAGA